MPGYLELAREALGALPPEPVRPEYEENEINEQIPPSGQAGTSTPAAPVPMTSADLYEFWGERAGIRQYDGGLPRDRAEALALEDVLQRMRAETSGPGAQPPH